MRVGSGLVPEWLPPTHHGRPSPMLRYRTCRREEEGEGRGHATSGTSDKRVPLRRHRWEEVEAEP